MYVLLNKHNRRKLVELVESGGIVLCEHYFLIGFVKDMQGKRGYWVITTTTYGGRDEEYSFFIPDGCSIDVYCFSPIEPTLN